MASKPVSTVKVKNFRRKIKELNDQELEMRAQVKRLYDQFILDVGDSDIALRHARQALFQIQKYRITRNLEERMEFHPLFGANPMSSRYFREFEEEDGEDDGLI